MLANSSSLSFTFQAILEQAMCDEKKLMYLVSFLNIFCFAKEGKIPLLINVVTLLIRCFGRTKMLEEAVSVYKELDPDSRNTSVINFLLDCLLRGGNIDCGFKVLDEMLKRDSDVPLNNIMMDIVLSAVWKRIWIEKMMSVEEIDGLLVRFFEHGVFWMTVDEELQMFEQMGGSETDGVLVKPFFLPSQLKGEREIGFVYLEEEK
ncbi:hypothetical protein FXO38_09060 [Capsicum annuum]|nr:hypothetical protein FXO38_09060 [Capsicum annuum]